jgi:hypothetical protein
MFICIIKKYYSSSDFYVKFSHEEDGVPLFENVAAHRVRYNTEMIKIVGQFL